MAQIISVYVGQKAQVNLMHGLRNGIWGFKEDVAKKLVSDFHFNQESYCILATGYKGDSVRTNPRDWNSKEMESIYLVKITSEIYKDSSPEWPNESQMDASERYICRFKFDPNNVVIYKDVPLRILPNDISESLRASAVSPRGKLVTGVDLTKFKNILSPYLDSNEKVVPMNNMTIKEVVLHTHQFIGSLGFQYEYEEIANFYLSLKTKPFVILAGISGTGKTQLARKFASALGFSNSQLIQVPVRPDWADASDLIGYKALNDEFIPKELTNAILQAKSNKDKPHFFILDEMNLARVEHYFSDFLSIIETRRRENNQIVTDPIIRDEILLGASNMDEFPISGWPANLYLIGTVNMDETTHAFSRKVLDRANSIEMNNVDLNWPTIASEKIPALSGISNHLFESSFISSNELSIEEKSSIRLEMELLVQVNSILQQADLHFAYRVRDEIAFYLISNKKYDLMGMQVALDFQLVQKVLPRIHGSSERIQRILIELLNLLEGTKFRTSTLDLSDIEIKLDLDNLKYKRASKKIIFMLKRFDEDRFTSFWL